MIVSFWVILTLVIYTYIGYPLLLTVIAALRKKDVFKSQIYPFVTVIIAAHNEEKSIDEKLKNTISLEYPIDKLEIIVASDNSTDKTNEIVANFNDQRVMLLNFSKRNGKTFVQNEAVKQAKGEILLFSDATTLYQPQLLMKIVRNFVDPQVAVVGGELTYINTNKTCVGEGGGFYWKYEKFLKQKESQISSLIGVSGCCYAIRKELYEPISPDLISDFVIAQMAYKRGRRAIYEPEAVSCEETNYNAYDEFRMRVRVAVRTLFGIWHMRSLLNPFKYKFYSLQLISHKIFRYLIPVFLSLLFLVNITLIIRSPAWFYKFSFYLQMFFYLSAFLGFILQNKKTPFYIPYYFCLTNFALLVGIFKFIKGENRVLWEPLRK